ncbi:MAG: TolC family protein [Bacteroidia bacterium]|nr:TolC family protein [Bacteroidia bacterium]MCX7652650.1 TolC family protein [Bacteroidia bacterium]MDW8416996.1 TolC family protein [Bacteroidia bacterium]
MSAKVILFVGIVFAQSSRALSLRDCIQYALTHAPTLQNAFLDYQLARQRINEVRAAGLPQVNANASLRYFVEIPTSLVPGEFFGAPRGTFIAVRFGVPYNLEISLTGTQLLFDGTYFVGLQAAKAVKELTYRNFQRSKTETVVAVSKAYYTTLVAQKRLTLLSQNIQQLELLVRQTKSLYESGFAEKLDYQRLEVSLNNLRTEQNKATELTALSYLALKLQMGMPLDTPIVLTDTLMPAELMSLLPDTLTESQLDFGRRWEYQILLQQRRALELNLKRYQVSYLPSLIAIGNLATQAQRNEFDFLDTKKRWFPIAFVGAQLQVPIFDGLRRASQISQARIELQKNQNELFQLRQALTLEAETARRQLLNNLRNLSIQQRNLELAEEVLRTARRKQELGVSSTVELLQAQTSYDQAQTNYTTALLEAYLAYIDWQKAIGTLPIQ